MLNSVNYYYELKYGFIIFKIYLSIYDLMKGLYLWKISITWREKVILWQEKKWVFCHGQSVLKTSLNLSTTQIHIKKTYSIDQLHKCVFYYMNTVDHEMYIEKYFWLWKMQVLFHPTFFSDLDKSTLAFLIFSASPAAVLDLFVFFFTVYQPFSCYLKPENIFRF